MSGNPVAIGPFLGGLNLREDARQIADNQLASCINFDIGRAGELTARPGLKAFRINGTTNLGLPAATFIIGAARLSTTGASRLFGVESGTRNVYYTDSTFSALVNWISTFAGGAPGTFSRAVQYTNKVWFIPKGTTVGGASTAINHDLSTNASAAVAGIPKGSGAIVFKDRLFVFGPLDSANTGTQRVYYSAATDFTSFPVNNFFDIAPGDGENVTAAVGSQDTLIFFKQHSVWALQYDTDPGLGALRKVNSEIGATGPDAVVNFQNEIYIIDERTIWRMQNFLFDDVGKSLNLGTIRTSVDFRSLADDCDVFGNRIVFTVATGVSGLAFRYFVYNTEIGAFAEYVFDEIPVKFFTITDLSKSEAHVAHNANGSRFYYFQPFDLTDANWGDYPANVTHIRFETKRFDYDGAHHYKRLFWWGVEALANKAFNLSAITDERLTSAVAAEASSAAVQGKHGYYRAYLPARFRYIQFILDSVQPSIRLTILNGVAKIKDKREVSAGATI